MTRRTWTFPELYEAARLAESGMSWPDVAARLGCNENTLRSLLRLHGVEYDLGKRPKREHKRADLVLQAVALRNTERLSWSLIAERIGWPRTPQALRVACSRHVARHGGKVAGGMPVTRRTRWGSVSVRA